MTALASGFDAVLLDLDGVVYVGTQAVPHAAEALAGCRDLGVRCVFVTNNASRSPDEVARHLADLGVPTQPADVVTSPQAAVGVLATLVPPGSRVLVVGGPGIPAALVEAGFVPVDRLQDDPAAVMQGFSPDLTWRDLAEASYAVRAGLPWVATNPDLTFPTARGIAPGNGALVRVVAETVGRAPDAVAGKPEPPLLHEAVARVGGGRTLMVGDRLDTDIAGGTRAGMPTLHVLTGVDGAAAVLAAVPEQRPTHLGADLRALLAPAAAPVSEPVGSRCGGWLAVVEAGRLHLRGSGDALDALRAASAEAWRAADAGAAPDHGPALTTLADLGG